MTIPADTLNCLICEAPIAPGTDRIRRAEGELHAACDPRRAEPAAAHRPRVLLAEDDAAVSSVFREYLAEVGYDVVVVENAAAAVVAVRERRADVVLLDVNTPGPMTAGDAVATMSALVPVIVITGRIEEDLPAAMRARGAVDFITKPVDMAELARRLAAIAGTR